MLPPLRERKEDIPGLANYFIQLYAKKENKTIDGLSGEAIKAMQNYHWPGNIRELENLMERCVLLISGRIITTVPIPANLKKNALTFRNGLKTMTENERDHILAALELCEWKIYGEGGAAEMLDINGSTLHSRMKKLGIEKKIGLR